VHTIEFGIFLKELNRQKCREFFATWKNISADFFYTIISNLETKKIATILKTVKAKEIKACLYDLPQEIRYKVTTLTRDLAGVFENVGQEVFRHSQYIADKFHVLKLSNCFKIKQKLTYRPNFIESRGTMFNGV